MNIKLILSLGIALALTGCSTSSGTAPESLTSATYIGVGNVEYDSLYHYGYNIGCRSAVTVKINPANNVDVESMKDPVLDGLTEFDKGWRSGVKACEDGISRSMYSVGTS
ncbi:hypothetical protein [Shewanella algidipiscicola]|uniref:hypothetical protein n=1 Tax=Shewanella algidipiscicola TaxID=614070 RepID=UPI000D7821F1|nr:hypothetical protein [Shewanella algidipiscicola]